MSQDVEVLDDSEAIVRSMMEGGDAPITMAAFKKRMGGTPQDVYLRLDGDGDGFLFAEDLSSSSSRVFNPPLDREEAEYAFKGLDANHDGAVCISEFFGMLRLGQFYRSRKQLEAVGAVIKSAPSARTEPATTASPVAAGPLAPPITAAQYRARLRDRSGPEGAFTMLDMDKDRSISLKEYRSRASGLFEPSLTRTEVEYSFKGFDSDSDNKITPTEFFGVMSLGHFFQTPLALQEAMPRHEGQTAPAPIAAAHGGSSAAPLTESTFVEHMRTSFVSPQAAFSSIDRRGDGILDFDDFVSGSRGFQKPLDDAQAMYAFKGFDTNDDHRITKDEFLGTLNIGHFFQSPGAIVSAMKSISPMAPNEVSKVDPKFNCDNGLASWEFEWSEEKQHWCCKNEQKGCEGASKSPQSKVWHATQDLMTLQVFVKRMRSSYGSPMDAFSAMDSDSDSSIDSHEFGAIVAAFKDPLTEQEADYAFAGLDVNGDLHISDSEFYGVLQVGRFYPSAAALKLAGVTLESSAQELDTPPAPPATFAPPASPPTPAPVSTPPSSTQSLTTTQLATVAATTAPTPAPTAVPTPAPTTSTFPQTTSTLPPTTTTLPQTTSTLPPTTTTATPPPFHVAGKAVPEADLELYRGVPAIVNGQTEVALTLVTGGSQPDQTQLDAVGAAFARGLHKASDLRISGSAVELKEAGSALPKAVVLWAATSSKDGGGLQISLREEAADIETAVKEAITTECSGWLKDAMVWIEVAVSYYGPSSSKLPFGKKLSLDIGRRPGTSSANGSPAFAKTQ